MVYQFLYQAVADIAFQINLVPVFLVEMKRSFYAVVSVSQLDGIFRFAFQEYPVRIFKVYEREHPVHNFEYQIVFIKRKTFRHGLFAYAVFSCFFYVHTSSFFTIQER